MIWDMPMVSLIHSISKEGGYDKGQEMLRNAPSMSFENQFHPGSTQSNQNNRRAHFLKFSN